MNSTILLKRGAKNKLPRLYYGEPAFVCDEKELYIGTEMGNIKLTNTKEIDNINKQLDIIKNETVYAKNFGLKADGITDDTIALQRAIDSLRPKLNGNLWNYQNCGGTVVLPKGNIRITDTIRLYSNIKLEGTNKSLFGRITDDTCIILDTTDKSKQAISFVGLDPTTNRHIDKLFITGNDMDNGVVTQTWNVTLESFTIKSKNDNHLAINLSCAVKCKINNISFNNFDVDIFASANWDNEINNCNTLCNFSHMVLVTGNSLLVNSVYINPTESAKTHLSSTHILYPYVNNENLVYKNIQTGIINVGLHGLNIEKSIIEKIKIGIQACMDTPSLEKFYNNCSINKIHIEHIEKAFVFRNIACLINGVYAYITPNTSEYLIEGYSSHITGINIQPIKYIKLFKEDIEGSYNFFGSVDEWVTGTNITKGSIGKTIFESYNEQAIRKTWQTQTKELIGDTTVEVQYVDLKDVKTCAINSSKLVITNPPESPIDVRYSNTVILNSPLAKTIYSFNAREFQEFTILAVNNNISLNSPESGGRLVIKNDYIHNIPAGGVMKFICYNGVCYEISRSF